MSVRKRSAAIASSFRQRTLVLRYRACRGGSAARNDALAPLAKELIQTDEHILCATVGRDSRLHHQLLQSRWRHKLVVPVAVRTDHQGSDFVGGQSRLHANLQQACAYAKRLQALWAEHLN